MMSSSKAAANTSLSAQSLIFPKRAIEHLGLQFFEIPADGVKGGFVPTVV